MSIQELRRKSARVHSDMSKATDAQLSVLYETLAVDDDGGYTSYFEAFMLFHWAGLNFPTFKLDPQAVDTLICTKAPPLQSYLGDPKPLADYSVASIYPPLVGLPYTVFAVELPYVVGSDFGGFRAALASPLLRNTDKDGALDWVLCTLEGDDLETGKSSLHLSTPLGSLLTNLCAYLAEGGEKVSVRGLRTRRRPSGPNTFKIKPPKTNLNIGIARSYLAAGRTPPRVLKIGTRFLVRGHWRNQRCGVGRRDTKRVWIAPHMKGPDDGKAWDRIYDVSSRP